MNLKNFNKFDIIDKQIGKLKVLAWARAKKTGRATKQIYTCQCECGTVLEIERPNLINYHTISCGCYRKNRNKQACKNTWTGYEEISGRLWGDIKKKAESRNLCFTITIEEAWNLFLQQNKKCALSGADICFSVAENRKLNDRTASLDRINSAEGYIPSNIQWVHKTLNIIKGNMENQKFIDLCCMVAEYKDD